MIKLGGENLSLVNVTNEEQGKTHSGHDECKTKRWCLNQWSSTTSAIPAAELIITNTFKRGADTANDATHPRRHAHPKETPLIQLIILQHMTRQPGILLVLVVTRDPQRRRPIQLGQIKGLPQSSTNRREKHRLKHAEPPALANTNSVRASLGGASPRSARRLLPTGPPRPDR